MVYILFIINGSSIYHVRYLKSHSGLYYSPLSLIPFPPEGAREVVAPRLFPAPLGGRMSKGQEAGFIQQSRLLQKPQFIRNNQTPWVSLYVLITDSGYTCV